MDVRGALEMRFVCHGAPGLTAVPSAKRRADEKPPQLLVSLPTELLLDVGRYLLDDDGLGELLACSAELNRTFGRMRLWREQLPRRARRVTAADGHHDALHLERFKHACARRRAVLLFWRGEAWQMSPRQLLSLCTGFYQSTYRRTDYDPQDLLTLYNHDAYSGRFYVKLDGEQKYELRRVPQTSVLEMHVHSSRWRDAWERDLELRRDFLLHFYFDKSALGELETMFSSLSHESPSVKLGQVRLAFELLDFGRLTLLEQVVLSVPMGVDELLDDLVKRERELSHDQFLEGDLPEGRDELYKDLEVIVERLAVVSKFPSWNNYENLLQVHSPTLRHVGPLSTYIQLPASHAWSSDPTFHWQDAVLLGMLLSLLYGRHFLEGEELYTDFQVGYTEGVDFCEACETYGCEDGSSCKQCGDYDFFPLASAVNYFTVRARTWHSGDANIETLKDTVGYLTDKWSDGAKLIFASYLDNNDLFCRCLSHRPNAMAEALCNLSKCRSQYGSYGGAPPRNPRYLLDVRSRLNLIRRLLKRPNASNLYLSISQVFGSVPEYSATARCKCLNAIVQLHGYGNDYEPGVTCVCETLHSRHVSSLSHLLAMLPVDPEAPSSSPGPLPRPPTLNELAASAFMTRIDRPTGGGDSDS